GGTWSRSSESRSTLRARSWAGRPSTNACWPRCATSRGTASCPPSWPLSLTRTRRCRSASIRRSRSPFIVALMTDLLGPEPHESILEVGTGLGYQAAVLAELSGRVWSVEIVEELAGQAEANLRQLGCSDVAIRIGDGSRGWREHAPYDRALLTAAAERLPPAILDQIKPRGRIVLPLGPDEAQWLTVVDKGADGQTSVRKLIRVRFSRLETVV